ncbi:hypothetical protein [Sporosalibacterium faouarense]|uniref:hypothetical protein n=1 Tax=Sporosalibacterium faouarense TaxID=516123 RepID=UPI00141C5CB6|nr:hypothetical protein [Sporosalibacterium faouarense]MTI48823.1 hypothetical protein [Bacillota bacterium]
MEYFNLVLVVIILGILFSSTKKYLKNKKEAGDVLIDLNETKSSKDKVLRLLGLAFSIVIIYFVFIRGEKDIDFFYRVIFWVLWYAYLVLIVVIDTKFTENGILKFTYFVKWSSIEKVSWSPLKGKKYDDYKLDIKFNIGSDKKKYIKSTTIKIRNIKNKVNSLFKEKVKKSAFKKK